MDLVLPIVLGLMLLASFYVAYMSAKSWPVYQAVLIVFILIGAMVFLYFGGRTLATHKNWGELVRRLELEIQSTEQQRLELVGGEQNAQGQPVRGQIPLLRQQLGVLVNRRGGALYEVAVDSAADSKPQLTLKSPQHSLVPNTVVFVFDELPLAEGGRYLGEFKVVTAAADDAKVQIAPNLPLTEEQAKRLAASKGPWTLYTTMPVDNVATFADLDEAGRAALLPAASVAEFGDRQRKLRDYERFFHDHFVQANLLADTISKTQTNIQRLEAAAKETQREIAFREGEKVNLTSDLANFRREQRAIADYQQALEARLVQVRETLRGTYFENRRLAAALTAAQFEAAAAIDARTEPPDAVAP